MGHAHGWYGVRPFGAETSLRVKGPLPYQGITDIRFILLSSLAANLPTPRQLPRSPACRCHDLFSHMQEHRGSGLISNLIFHAEAPAIGFGYPTGGIEEYLSLILTFGN